MKLLIPLDQVKLHKGRKKTIPLECEFCKNTFYECKGAVKTAIKDSKRNRLRHCSRSCSGKSIDTKKMFKCEVCGKEILKKPSSLKKHVYCSIPCAAKVSNSNRISKGNHRSKLETWLESILPKKYSQIEFEWNNRKLLNGLELDIYIPKHKLAFELNGIFHYEPIFGENHLNKIINRDKGKFQRCIEKGISLCVIDCTSMKYFKEEKAAVFLEIIQKILDDKMAESRGPDPQPAHTDPTDFESVVMPR
jgi:hypothetical protein